MPNFEPSGILEALDRDARRIQSLQSKIAIPDHKTAVIQQAVAKANWAQRQADKADALTARHCDTWATRQVTLAENAATHQAQTDAAMHRVVSAHAEQLDREARVQAERDRLLARNVALQEQVLDLQRQAASERGSEKLAVVEADRKRKTVETRRWRLATFLTLCALAVAVTGLCFMIVRG